MTHDPLSPTSMNSLHSMKNPVDEVEASLRHLDHAVGGHMQALARALNHISGRKPLVQHASTVDRSVNAAMQAMLRRDMQSAIRGTLMAVLKGNDGNMRVSQGQMMADLASSISRAMSRNL